MTGGSNDITTERLYLTPFAPAHAADLQDLNSDPQVMRYLGGPVSRAEGDAVMARAQARWRKYGYGWWAVLLRDGGPLVGAACLQNLAHVEDAPLEIGWRLMPRYHGKGYAIEAGRAAMAFGFDRIGVDRLVAVAHPDNVASHKVMQRLWMNYRGIETHYDEPCVVYDIYQPFA